MSKTRKKIALFDVINVVGMLIFAVSILYPFYYCLLVAFNDGYDSMIPGMYLWPRKFTLANFDFIFHSANFLQAFTNSVLRTVLGTLAALAVTFTASYGLYKLRFLKKVYTVFFIIPMYVSGGLIPFYLVVKTLGLLDNFFIYILPATWSFFNALLFMAYFRSSIDSAIEESAQIDGASSLRILVSIILPVSLPVIATVALFCAVGQWNSWFDTVIYTKSESLRTLQSLLMKLINEAESMRKLIDDLASKGQNVDRLVGKIQPNGVRVATMFVVIVPILCVYPFLQRYFVKGIMIGAVKG